MTPPSDQPALETADQALEAVLDKTWSWVEGFVLMLPNLAVALGVVVVAAMVAGLVARGVRSVLSRGGLNPQLTTLAGTVARTAVILGGLFLALSVLDLDKTVTSLLAGVGVVGLALGFAFQDIAANFMAGVMMAAKRPFEVGDWIRVAGYEGTVLSIDLRSVLLTQFSGEITQIPNKDVFQNPLTNVTRSGERRISFAVGVNYDSDLASVRQVALGAIREHHGVQSRDAEVHVTGFGASSIDLDLRFWIANDDELGGLERKTQAMIAVQQAFDANGIDIPFPTRHLLQPLPSEADTEHERAAK